MSTDSFQIATPVAKKYKLFFWGPEGCYKTRTALRLGNVAANEDPALAMVDTEAGSEHFSGDFRFLRTVTTDPDKVFTLVKNLIRKPGSVKTLVIDSFSVYYQSLVSKYADLFLKREINSKGNKVEYYVIQPRDYQAINREAYNFVRMLIACDLNVIVTAHAKDKWEEMKVVGLTPDAPKKMSHYFDTVIEIEMGVNSKFNGIVRSKDRTNKLKVGEKIPWDNDVVSAKFISEAFGHTLADSAPAIPMDIDIQAGPAFGADAPTKADDVPFDVDEEAKDEIMSKDKAELLKTIANLKKTARIVDKNVWIDLLKPYGVTTANHMDIEQLNSLASGLEKLCPTEALAA